MAYSLYSSIVLSLLYLTYKWIMAPEKQMRLNRTALWSIYLASLAAMPAAKIIERTWHTIAAQPNGRLTIEYMTAVFGEPAADAGNLISATTIAIIIYIIGVLAVTAHTLWCIMKIHSIVRDSETVENGNGYRVVITRRNDISPFSYMHTIVMNRDDYDNYAPMILLHERSHINRHHCIDLLASQIVCILQWYNPASWLMREEFRTIHEYQADDTVIRSGTANIKDYQMLLIKKAVGTRFAAMANSLNHSKLKKRITMMYNSKTSRRRRMRSLALVPALAIGIAVTNLPAVASLLQETSEASLNFPAHEVSENPAAAQLSVTSTPAPQTDKVHHAAEVQPQYPGGQEAMLKFIANEMVYPADAIKNNQEGRVVLQFVVGADGKVRDISVMRSASPLLDAEAIRIVSQLSGFTAGTIDGKPVSVYYTLPIQFKLEKDNAKPKAATATKNDKKDKAPRRQVVEAVDEAPQYPGGQMAMMDFLIKNMKYPEKAMKDGTEGRVVVQFTVDTKGNAINPQVMRSVSPELDTEAIRIVSLLEGFTPGKVNGQPASINYTLPISFKLEKDTEE